MSATSISAQSAPQVSAESPPSQRPAGAKSVSSQRPAITQSSHNQLVSAQSLCSVIRHTYVPTCVANAQYSLPSQPIHTPLLKKTNVQQIKLLPAHQVEEMLHCVSPDKMVGATFLHYLAQRNHKYGVDERMLGDMMAIMSRPPHSLDVFIIRTYAHAHLL